MLTSLPLSFSFFLPQIIALVSSSLHTTILLVLCSPHVAWITPAFTRALYGRSKPPRPPETEELKAGAYNSLALLLYHAVVEYSSIRQREAEEHPSA